MAIQKVTTIAAFSALTIAQGLFGATAAQPIFLTPTPVAVQCTVPGEYVRSFTIRTMPGGTGKVYVGQANFSTATLNGVAAILSPNGGHTEEYTVTDPSGIDGIDMCRIYVSGAVGDRALVETDYAFGTFASPAYALTSARAYGAAGPEAISGNLNFTSLRIQVIPGNTGHVALMSNTLKSGAASVMLSPNTFVAAQHSAQSESWSTTDPSGNNGLSLAPTGYTVYPMVAGESALVSIWQKQAFTGAIVPTTTYRQEIGFAFLQTAPTRITFSDPTVHALRFRIVPGQLGKVYVGEAGLNPATGDHVAKTLSPTNNNARVFSPDSLGHAESFTFASGGTMGTASIYAASEVAGTAVTYDYLVLTSGTGTGTSGYFASAQSDRFTPAAAGSPIGRGKVQSLQVSIAPGWGSMVYIGTSSMNTTTLSGVVAVLYSNPFGRWSESFELNDPTGDGIDTDSLYVSTQVGQSVLVSTTKSGFIPAFPLTIKASGALSTTGTTIATVGTGSVASLRLQAVPRQAGMVHVGTSALSLFNYTGNLKVLQPSMGNYNVGEGHSERFVADCSNGCNLSDYRWFPETSGTQLIVAAFGR